MSSLASVANALHAHENIAISAGARTRTAGELALEIVAGFLTGGIAVLAMEAYKYYSSQKNLSDFTKIAPEIFNKLDSVDDKSGDKSVSINIGKDVEIGMAQIGKDVVLSCGKEQITLADTNFEAIKKKIIGDILGNPQVYGSVCKDFLVSLDKKIEGAVQVKLDECVEAFRGDLDNTHSEQYALDFPRTASVVVEQVVDGSKTAHPQKVRVPLNTMVPDRLEKYKFEPGDCRKNVLPLLVNQTYRSMVGMAISNVLLENHPDAAKEVVLSGGAFNDKTDNIFRISEDFETDRTIYVETRFGNGNAGFNSVVAVKFTQEFFEQIKSGTYADSKSVGIESIESQGFAATSELYNPEFKSQN